MEIAKDVFAVIGVLFTIVTIGGLICAYYMNHEMDLEDDEY